MVFKNTLRWDGFQGHSRGVMFLRCLVFEEELHPISKFYEMIKLLYSDHRGRLS